MSSGLPPKRSCPNCKGALTEIGLEDGSTTQECRWCSWSLGVPRDGAGGLTGDRIDGQYGHGRSGWPCRWPVTSLSTSRSSTAPALPGAAAPHRPDHRRNRTGAGALRAQPPPRSARPVPNGPRTLRAAQCREGWHLDREPDPRRPAPPPRTRSGGSSTAPRSRPAATRPQLPGRHRVTWTSCSPNSMRKSAAPGIRGKVTPDRASVRHRLDQAASGRPSTLPRRKVDPADGRQDLHRTGRQDVPAVAIPHPHLPVLRQGDPVMAPRADPDSL